MPRPRTFEEVVAAHDPADKVRIKRGECFIDPSVNPFHGEVSLNEDRDVKGDWRVEYFDDDFAEVGFGVEMECRAVQFHRFGEDFAAIE